MMLFDLYTVYFLGIYAWQKLIIDHEGQIIGRLVSNQVLSPTVQGLRIALPQGQTYQAGDFYFIRFKNKKISKEKHPFSVASSPSKSPQELRFLIQAVGDFTGRIKQVPVGTKVLLEGPFGRFAPIVVENPAPLVLYGLGSGIAPLLSMAEEFAPNRLVHIIWSAKGEEEFYLNETFEELARKYTNLTYHGKPHRFSTEELQGILTADEIVQANFFVVGSAPVLLKVEQNLQEIGVPKEHIHDERLTM